MIFRKHERKNTFRLLMQACRQMDDKRFLQVHSQFMQLKRQTLLLLFGLGARRENGKQEELFLSSLASFCTYWRLRREIVFINISIILTINPVFCDRFLLLQPKTPKSSLFTVINQRKVLAFTNLEAANVWSSSLNRLTLVFMVEWSVCSQC